MDEALKWFPTLVSLVTLVFGFGLFYQRIIELERRVVLLEQGANESNADVLAERVSHLTKEIERLSERLDRLDASLRTPMVTGPRPGGG